jgi:hypothetical protein
MVKFKTHTLEFLAFLKRGLVSNKEGVVTLQFDTEEFRRWIQAIATAARPVTEVASESSARMAERRKDIAFEKEWTAWRKKYTAFNKTKPTYQEKMMWRSNNPSPGYLSPSEATRIEAHFARNAHPRV